MPAWDCAGPYLPEADQRHAGGNKRTNPGIHLKLALASAEMYKTLAQELEYDIEYHNRGGMILIE